MVIDHLFIGDTNAESDMERLKLLGVSHIVIAAAAVEPRFPKDFKYLKV
jgi:hypothetical protein